MLLQIKIFISVATWIKTKHNKTNKHYLELKWLTLALLIPLRYKFYLLISP